MKTAIIKAYITCTQGATAIEYGLIATGVAVLISGSVYFFGEAVYGLLYENLPSALQDH